MNNRSAYVPFLLTIVAILTAVGLYLYIDAASLARQEQARLAETVEQNTRAIEKLSEMLRRGMVQIPSANNSSTTSTTPTNANTLAPTTAFANDDLRDPDAESGGILRTYTQAFSGNLNSIVTNEALVSSIWGRCVDSLATRNNLDVMKFEPVLADSWQISDDGLVYTIHIRESAMWQSYIDPVTKKEVNAKPVTSDDFVFFWEIMQNKEIPCDAQRTYYELVDRIEAVDNKTVRVIWKEPYSLANEITLGLSPMPRHYYRPDPTWTDSEFAKQMMESQRNQFIVSCGQYKLGEWDTTKGLTLVVNDDYYGPKPALSKIEYKLIKDSNLALVELKKGNLDSIGLMPEQWIKETPAPEFYTVTNDPETAADDSKIHDLKKKNGGLPTDYTFEKFQSKRFVWYYIGYNMSRPLFSDRRVRTALTHLTDRQRILSEVYFGFGVVMTGPFVPQSPYYNHNVNPIPFDPEAAKKLLADAGWSDTDGDGWLDKDIDGDGKRDPFRFTFLAISSSENQRKFSAIIQQDLKKAGIDMQIKPTEWAVYQQFLEEKNFDVCSLGWSGGIESDPYQIWHSSQADLKASSNHVGYKSDEADKLIEEGRRTTDLNKRIEIYRKFFEIVHNDQPYTFLFAPTSLSVQHRRYRNARVYVNGMDSTLMWVPAKEQIQ